MDLLDNLRALVSDWQANGNSRPLGDPTADTWHDCARQLLHVVNSEAGRRLASERDDLIASGVDPSELVVPIHPEDLR